MALDSALLTRVRLLAAAAETTTGTAISVGSNNAAMNVFDLKTAINIPPYERPGQASLSNLPPIPTSQSGKMTFRTELYNDASGPEWLSVLLPACGWGVNTGVYQPSSGANVTLTLAEYQQGNRVRTLAGCAGTFRIVGESGKPLSVEWEFTGKYAGTSSASFLTPSFPTAKPPRFAGATLTIGGNSFKISKFTLDMGNTVYLREDCTDSTSFHSCQVVNRKPVLTVDPEAVAYASQNWPASHLAGATASLSMEVGTGSNNIITIAAPSMVLLNPPNDGDRGGILVDNLEFLLTPQPFGSQDTELTITPS